MSDNLRSFGVVTTGDRIRCDNNANNSCKVAKAKGVIVANLLIASELHVKKNIVPTKHHISGSRSGTSKSKKRRTGQTRTRTQQKKIVLG